MFQKNIWLKHLRFWLYLRKLRENRNHLLNLIWKWFQIVLVLYYTLNSHPLIAEFAFALLLTSVSLPVDINSSWSRGQWGSGERYIIRRLLGLPCWFSGKESTCQCRRCVFNPWSRKIPQAAEQLSQCTTTTEALTPWSPCSATGEATTTRSPHTTARE